MYFMLFFEWIDKKIIIIYSEKYILSIYLLLFWHWTDGKEGHSLDQSVRRSDSVSNVSDQLKLIERKFERIT